MHGNDLSRRDVVNNYLLDKRFRRKFGIALTAIWVRERHRNKRTRQPSEGTPKSLP